MATDNKDINKGGWANSNPRIAGELTLGHGTALVILETDADITPDDVRQTVQRISGITPDRCHVSIVPQDPHLADIVERARLYVHTQHGSFERMAEYGLIA